MRKNTLLLDTGIEGTGGGGDTAKIAEAIAKVAPSGSPKPATAREPSASEKAINFKIEPGDPMFAEKFPTQQLPERTVAPKIEPPTKEPLVKPEAKVEPKPEVKPIAGKEIVEPVKIPGLDKKEGTATRDYTGYSTEEQTVLKQMSNPAFEYTSKLLKEKKELEKLKGASYLQSPVAYQLDPEFQAKQTEVSFLNQEAEYWKSQLSAIKNGESWKPYLGTDAQGNHQFGPERKGGPVDEEQVRLAMNQCYQLAQQAQGGLQQYAQTYQQRIQQDNANIQAEQARRLPWVADPKLQEHRVEIPGVGERSLAQIKSEFVNLFPSYQRSTIGVDVAANLFVALQMQGIQLREAQAGKQIAEIKSDEVRRAEPTSHFRPPTDSVKSMGGVTKFSLAGLPV